MPRPIAELISSKPDARRLVEDGLNLLEAEHRELALVSLAAWCRVLTPAADLFDAVASMRRPAWGAWDRLMQALGRCHADVAGTQLAPPRRQAADLLGGVARLLDEKVETAPLRPLAQLTGTRLPKDTKVAVILRLPIPLRNRIAHGPPATADGWKVLAEALEPLLRWHAQRGLAAGLNDPDARPAPWFLPPLKPGEPSRAFNGLHDDGSAIYAGPDGWEFSIEAGAEVRQLLCRLLGREDLREADFRRLLPLLAPRERQGVLLGDYLLGAPVDGRGGADASVHEGWELGTGRKVALKVLRAASSSASERFRREARHLARFSQANVVGLYDSGEERWRQPPVPVSGLPWLEELKREPTRTFIAMEWVDGQTLENVIRAGRVARPRDRELAGWFLQGADALSAVHAAGLLHRDVKPSNLMVTADGSVKLMDFGIADDRSAPEQGATTARMGTPPYMSPEQARAADANAGDEDRARIGPAIDIYGLCATFYELYTGRRLYDHDSESGNEALRRKLEGVAPEMPRRRGERLPWEIETILLGGLEAEPSRRYASAEELKRDLRLYQEDRPIERKRPSLLHRLSLGYRRNRVVTNLIAIAAMLFIVGAAQYVAVLKREQSATKEYAEGLGRQEKETRKYADGLEEQQRETIAKAKEVQAGLARWHLSTGRRYHEAGDSLSALPHYVEALALDTGDTERERPHRIRIGALLRHTPRIDIEQVWTHPGLATVSAFSPDGRQVLLGFNDGTAEVRQVGTGKASSLRLAAMYDGHWSPDGRRFVGVCRDGMIRVWDPTTGAVIVAMRHGRSLEGVRSSADGRRLVSFGGDGYVRVWDSAGKQIQILKHASAVTQALFDKTSEVVVTVDDGGTGRAWDAVDGGLLGEPVKLGRLAKQAIVSSTDGNLLVPTERGDVSAFAITKHPPDGLLSLDRVIAIPDSDGLASFQHNVTIRTDGRQYATLSPMREGGGLGERIILMEPEKPAAPLGQAILSPRPAPQEALLHVVRPDDKLDDFGHRPYSQTIRVCNLSGGSGPYVVTPSHIPFTAGSVERMALSSDGQRVALAVSDGSASEILIWETPTHREILPRRKTRLPASSLQFSPDGRRLLVTTRGPIPATPSGQGVMGDDVQPREESEAWLLDTHAGGGNLAVLPWLGQRVRHASFSPDGSRLATVGGRPCSPWSEWLSTHDAVTGDLLLPPVRLPGVKNRTAFSGDGKSLLVIGSVELSVRDSRTGEVRPSPLPRSGSREAEFSPDGGRAVIWGDGKLWMEGPTLLDGRSVMQAIPLPHALARQCGFSPDGSLLFTVGGPDVRLWDARSGTQRGEPLRHSADVRHVAWSPVGGKLAVCLTDGTVRVRELGAASNRPETLLRHEGVKRALFDPSGRRLATIAADGPLRIWDAGGLPVASISHGPGVVEVAFDAHGALAATVSTDGSARVWEVASGDPLTVPLTHPIPDWSECGRRVDQDVRMIEPGASIIEARFSPCGPPVLLTLSRNGVMRLWDLSEDGRAVSQLRAIAGLTSGRRWVAGRGEMVPVDKQRASLLANAKLARQASDSPPDHSALRWKKNQAAQAVQFGWAVNAAPHLSHLIAAEPKNPLYLLEMAWLYAGELDAGSQAHKGTICCRRAVEAAGGAQWVWLECARIHAYAGRLNEAVAASAEAERKEALSWEACLERAELLLRQGKDLVAKPLIHRILVEKRYDDDACRSLASLILLRKFDAPAAHRPGAAPATMSTSGPKGVATLSFTSVCALVPNVIDDYKVLISLAEREAKQAGADDYHCARALGAALMRAGEIPRATEALERAAKLTPRGVTLWLLLALAHDKAGDKLRADDCRAEARKRLAASTPAVLASLRWDERLVLELLCREAGVEPLKAK